MTTSPAEIFTAARIARALGRSRQSVHHRLSKIAPDGSIFDKYKRAAVPAWNDNSPDFPRDLQAKLDAVAKGKGHANRRALLRAGLERFRITDSNGRRVTFSELAPTAQERALKLQRALTPLLPRRDDLQLSALEFDSRGTAEYNKVFGYAIQPKTWRALLNRTIERDGGEENWRRVDIYVEPNPALRQVATRSLIRARAAGFDDLHETLTELGQRESLSVEDRALLWTRSCDELQAAIDAGRKLKQSKRAILSTIYESRLLRGDFEALRKTFSRKWEVYLARESKPCINRSTLRPKQELAENDRNLIAAKIIDADGCIQQGWDRARESGELSDELSSRYAASNRKVPALIAREAGTYALSNLPLHKGERVFKHSGPYIQQDYAKLFAGEEHEMDDGTPEHVWWSKCENFPGSRILQGQIIVTVDRRTGRALGFGLVEDSYHGRVIRSTETRACRDFGIPLVLNIERGLWQRARVIVGAKTGIVSIDQWEMGLREFMSLRHARDPQGKAIVERFFRFLWDRLRPLPGYVGRDMRTTCPRELHKQILAGRSGKIHPSEFCLSKEQFIDAIERAMAEYNATPQFGRLNGLSPNAAWDAFQSPGGLSRLTNEAAYLMVYHREERQIKRRQLKRKIGNDELIYHSPDTARYDLQKVLMWWNPDDNSVVWFSSLDRKQGPFAVPLIERCPRTAQTAGAAIGRARAVVDATNAAKRAEYRSIQPFLAKTKFRTTLIDRSTVEVGERLEASGNVIRKQQGETTRKVNAARQLARETKFVSPDAVSVERAGTFNPGMGAMVEAWAENERDRQ